MGDIHQKYIEGRFKFLNGGSPDKFLINATLSTIGNVDKVQDKMLPGAFDKWLDTMPSKLPILWNHNRDEPIGFWDDFRMDGVELSAKGTILTKASRGKDASVLIEGGAVQGVSIGFESNKWEPAKEKDRASSFGIDFKEVSLREASIVTFPANEFAGVKAEADRRRSLIMPQSDETLKSEIRTAVNAALRDFKSSDELLKDVQTNIMKQLERPDSPLAQVKGMQESLKADLDGLSDMVKDVVNTHLDALERNRRDVPVDITHEWVKIEDGPKGYRLETTIEDAIAQRAMSSRYQKAITTYDATPGARQAALSPWQQMLERNPFRNFVIYYPAVGQGTVTLPNLSQSNFVDTAHAGVNIPDGTGITSATHTLATQSLMTLVARLAGSQVPGLREAVQSMIGMKAANAHGHKCAGVIEGSIEAAAGFGKVTTGVASSSTKLGLPLSPTDALADLKAALDTPYSVGGVIFCTRAFYAQLKKATSGTGGAWAWDPALRAERFDGTPIITTSHIEDANSADATTVAFYGDLGQGVILAEALGLRIDEYSETNPGQMTFFAQMQYLYIINDTNSVVGLVTGT